jgi:hypothetical protein
MSGSARVDLADATLGRPYRQVDSQDRGRPETIVAGDGWLETDDMRDSERGVVMSDTVTEPAAAMPRATRDLGQAKRDLDDFGVAILRGALSPDTVGALRARLEEQAELERAQGVATFADPAFGEHPTQQAFYHMPGSRIGRPRKDPPFQFIGLLPNKGQAFIDLCGAPAFLEMARHALKDDFLVSTLSGLVVRKGAPAQFIHADQSVVPFSTPQPILLNLMIPLGAFTAAMGATRFVPGSHRRTAPGFDAPPGGPFANLQEIKTVPAEMQAGDVCFFDSRIWHGQGPCTSDAARWSIVLNYAVHWWRTYDNYAAALHDDVFDAMSPHERVLFGFRIVRNGSGRVEPRYAGDRRCNTNARLPFVPELRRGSPKRAAPAGEVEEW